MESELLAKEMFEVCHYPAPELWDEQDQNTKDRWIMNAEIIAKHFSGTRGLTPLQWFTTPNPLLGNVSPWAMIKAGRGEKLCKWIDNQLEENAPIVAPSKQALDVELLTKALMTTQVSACMHKVLNAEGTYLYTYDEAVVKLVTAIIQEAQKLSSQHFSGTRGWLGRGF